MSTEIQKSTGRFTLPAQAGCEKEVKTLAEKWGADAFRDSDGTVLSDEILDMGFDIYSTLCMIRADQDFPKENPDQCQQKFLISDPVSAQGDTLEIDILKGYSKEQFQIDTIHDCKKYWEVYDRTTGQMIDTWEFDSGSSTVKITQAEKWHAYTVSFLVFQVWETTSMYNYITNDWTGEHQKGIDPYQPATRAHLLKYLDRWLDEHPNTNVVRFTSIAYQFPIITDENRKTRYQDWCGYLDCISPLALDEFEKERGYRLRAEHLVDQGYYNDINRPPSREYLDWIDFVNKFTTEFTKEWVELVHKKGRKAMMFFCDHWIGTEPYNAERFGTTNFDALVNPVINGSELRRMADVPGDYLKEVRLYPYFFPENLMGDPCFSEGGDPVGECKRYWVQIRRALLRRSVDRIGFGGYLELAVKHQGFLEYVELLANEFRSVRDNTEKTLPYSSITVAILDAWGVRRSWMHKEAWPLGGITESLSGLPVDVRFISFDDIRANGIPADVDVIINKGVAGTSWSGGDNWKDPQLLATIREWIGQGGGFFGLEEPTAGEYQGRYFQLADVFGVDRETGCSKSRRKNIQGENPQKHFITADLSEELVVGDVTQGIHAIRSDVDVLATQKGSIALSAASFGTGRSVYMGGYSFTPENTRLLYRSLLWAASKESELATWFSSNPNTECAYYPKKGLVVVINNVGTEQETVVSGNSAASKKVTLGPEQMIWLDAAEIS